jgi:amino acid transporter
MSGTVVEEERSQAMPGGAGLRRNTVGVLGAVALAAAFMGPATSVYFGSIPAAGRAGGAMTLSFVLTAIGALLVASTIAQFARKLPTAGMGFTFITRTFGAKAGMVAGWVLLIGYIPIPALLLAAIGTLSHDFFDTHIGLDIPWWIFTIVFAGVILAIVNSGVRRSTRTALIFLALEIVVMTALFLTIVVKGGADGNTLSAFDPGSSPEGITGIGYGILWGFVMFFGFESAATLGEEATDPKRTVPRALFTGVLIIGAFYVLSGYALTIGVGMDGITGVESTVWDEMASTYWGSGIGWLLQLTVLNSIFAILVASFNASVRVTFAMGREGILPRSLGTTSATSQVPVRAGYVLMSIVLGMVLLGGIAWGPLDTWFFLSVLTAIALLFIYIGVNAALPVFYRREHPAEFSPLRHVVMPLVGTLVVLLPIYGSIWPVPDYPLNLVPYVFVAWVLIGIGYAMWAANRRPEVLRGMERAFAAED